MIPTDHLCILFFLIYVDSGNVEKKPTKAQESKIKS